MSIEFIIKKITRSLRNTPVHVELNGVLQCLHNFYNREKGLRGYSHRAVACTLPARRHIPIAVSLSMALVVNASVFGQTAFFSLQGDIVNGDTDKPEFLFNLSDSVSNAETLQFQTFHNSGGTNAAGVSIPGDSFDPVLRLFNGSHTQIAGGDDSPSGLDSLLNFAIGDLEPIPSPIGPSDFTLELASFRVNSIGPWAVDLVGPASKMTLTGLNAVGTSTINSLIAGNDAQINLGSSFTLNSGRTFELRSGAAWTGLTTLLGVGSASTGTVIIDGAGSSLEAAETHIGSSGGAGIVTASNGATANLGSVMLGLTDLSDSTGTLNVQSDADVTTGNMDFVASSSSATVNVTGAGTTLTQIGDSSLTVGHGAGAAASLNVNDSGTFTSGGGGITVASNGTIDVNGGAFNANSDIVIDGGVVNLSGGGGGGGSGGGSVMNAMAITVINSAAFNFTGGTLHLNAFNGNLINQGGTLAPGHSPGSTPGPIPGLTQVQGDYTQISGALQIELGGLTAETQHDQVTVTGNAALADTLTIELIDGFNPAYGDIFTIMTYGSRTGIFTHESGLLLSTTKGLAPVYSTSDLKLRTTAPGDANGDGKVNAIDLNVLAINWLQAGKTWNTADWTGDGVVDVLDLNLLAINWQFGVGGPNSPAAFDMALFYDALAAVAPEPSSFLLLVTGGMIGLGRSQSRLR